MCSSLQLWVISVLQLALLAASIGSTAAQDPAPEPIGGSSEEVTTLPKPVCFDPTFHLLRVMSHAPFHAPRMLRQVLTALPMSARALVEVCLAHRGALVEACLAHKAHTQALPRKLHELRVLSQSSIIRVSDFPLFLSRQRLQMIATVRTSPFRL